MRIENIETRLITDDYRAQCEEMHRAMEDWGNRRSAWIPIILNFANACRPRSILDYGCGKGWLAKDLRADGHKDVREYDPAIPQKSKMPVPADLVICNDVLEHVEPELVENVLIHLHSLIHSVGFFNIVLHEARRQQLPDGTNPHKSIHDAEWWLNHLSAFWDIEILKGRGFDRELTVAVYPYREDPLFIANVPRSGSSLLASILSKAGVWVGGSVPKDAGNPLGYYENRTFVDINRAMLKTNGFRGACHPPLPQKLKWERNLKAEVYRELPTDLNIRWLFKDGKLIRTWMLWDEAFPNAKWIFPQRDRKAILDSMERHPIWKRRGNRRFLRECIDEMSRGQEIIEQYVGVRCVRIDSGSIVDIRESEIAKLAAFTGLPITPQIVREMVDASHWH